MASCDDDFALLGDDHPPHHIFQPPQEQQQQQQQQQQQPYAPHSFAPRHAPQLQPQPQPIAETVATVECVDGDEEGQNDSESTFATFDNNSQATVDVRTTEKRKDREDLKNGGAPSPSPCASKKAKAYSNEYRKDREEWSDAAIGCLLDAYLEKFAQLNRGNLRGRDWEEVAVLVSERCEKQSKSVEQCKNKVDNLKKRYKLERHRMNNGGISASHWPWFKKMEEIVGNSLPVKGGIYEDKGSSSATSSTKHSKRYVPPTPGLTGQINNIKAKQSSRWRRVVFKISGDALCGNHNNIDPKVAMLIASEVVSACRLGVEVAIVVGGSNFFSGDTWVTETGSERSTAYQIGMMASVMNSILLQSALEKMGAQAHVQTAFAVPEVTEPYNRQRAIRHLEKGRVVVFGGIGAGIGNPLFSTDTAAALRASEIHAEVILKGTPSVDGGYDCQSRDNNATFEHISFRDLGSRGATIPMDPMALSFCDENGIPVVVFNLEPGNISKALCGDQVGIFIDQNGRMS